MCLLIVVYRMREDAPLVVAANRDELLARPAAAMEVLRPAAPRVLGGRDLAAGGSWLAVNEHGVVAALTNRPSSGGPDRTRRSRGELILALAAHDRAAAAARHAAASFRTAEYNPCWVLVGDRETLHYIDMTAPALEGRPAVRELGPGVHVLENRALEEESEKAQAVQRAAAAAAARAPDLVDALAAVLRDHGTRACVHLGPYGTRWAGVVVVPAAPGVAPDVRYADGPPCVAPLASATTLWKDR